MNFNPEAKMKRPSVNNVLQYSNNDVIQRFIEKSGLSNDDSTQLFNETLKWLWLCNETRFDNINKEEKFNLFIYFDSIMIDEMWHNFILFTKEYTEFCFNYFGSYLHHSPINKNKFQKEEKSDLKLELKKMYSYIYDKLGPETLDLWFRTYPEKFNDKVLRLSKAK